MYSGFFVILLISLAFFGIFYVQRLKDPVYYFSFGELVYGIKTSVKPVSLLLRFLIIIVFSFILNVFRIDQELIILGCFLGAFLIVWPGILHPEKVDYRIQHRKRILYVLYLLFIILSAFSSYLGFVLYGFFMPEISRYIIGFLSINRLFSFLLDGICFTILLWLFHKITAFLNKEIDTTPTIVLSDDYNDNDGSL